MCFLASSTGAAQKRFCVNTPATARARREAHHQQVLAARLLDAGHRHPEFDAGNGQQGFGLRGGEIYCHYESLPWQCLYFLPEPQGQGSLRPTFCPTRTGLFFGASATATSPFSGSA